MPVMRDLYAALRSTGAHEGDPAPTRLLTTAYMVALGLIAALSLGAHLVLGVVIDEQEHTARVVGLSGKQAALSQRVALFAERYRVTGGDRERRLLLEAAEEMSRGHEALLVGGEAFGLPEVMPDAVRAIYFDEPERLDRRVRLFIQYAERLAGERTEDSITAEAAYDFLRVQATHELPDSLDRIVAAYEAHSLARIGWFERVQTAALVVIILTLTAEALLIFRPLVRRVQAYAARLFHLAMTDTMTGVSNRRAFMDLAGREIARARRHGYPLAVLLLDIDRFKSINDTRGHAIGDEAIIHLVKTAQAAIRPEDQIGRLGGEEFAVLAPYAQGLQAEMLAERVRLAVADSVLSASDGAPLPMTVSVGVAEVEPAESEIEPAIIRADIALYQSKTGGRNRVTRFAEGMGMTESRTGPG